MRVFAVRVSLSFGNGCYGIGGCECHLALEMDAMALVGMTNINVYTSSAHEYVPGVSQPLEPSIW